MSPPRKLCRVDVGREMPKKTKAPSALLALPSAGSSAAGSSATGSVFRISKASGAVSLAPRAPAAAAPPPSQLGSLAPAAAAQAAAAASMSRGERKKIRESTAGADWGHMRAPTLTTELKRDLLVVKMRNVLDPKRFYRSSDDGKGLPKYFQMGTLVEGATDQNKLTRKQRKGTMVEELLSDDAVRKRAKSQFLKFQAETMAGRERKGSRKGPAKGGRSGKAGSRGVQKQRR